MPSKRKPAAAPANPRGAPRTEQDSVIELFNAAARLTESGDRAGAIAAYQAWLVGRTSPWRHAALFNLGVLQMGGNDLPAAEHSFRQALEVQPGFLQAAFNLGTCLEKQNRLPEALDAWARLTGLPDDTTGESRKLLVLALNNSGRVLEGRKIYARAEQLMVRSLRLDPDQPQVIHHLVHLRQKQCAWPVLQELPGVTAGRMIECTSALAMLDLTDDPALQLAAARRFVEEKVDKDLVSLAPAQGYGHRRMRVAYLSSDFCLHPVSMLMVELFEQFDRELVEVYGFSWSRDDGSDLRRRVVGALDHYIPIADMSDEQAAACIREHEIDILVDLQGLTSGARPNLLARRPAPHQVAYLGFPGTSGMPFIDHVLCDAYVLPPEAEAGFTESPLRLPQVFQVCDTKRVVGPTPTRASCGLPDEGFVFCAFNNNHKITPEMFTTWMRILHQVPGSVLWLLADNESVPVHLRHAAQALGVAPERLVFAQRVLPAEYLARYRLADLFLDAFPFNGGTTANDALWMGVPVITRSGRSFASRMAGSLLHSLGLPQLVVGTQDDYERRAVELARSAPGGEMQQVRARLEAARTDARLFDTRAQARDIEDLFLGLLGRQREVAPPQAQDTPQRVFNYRGRAHAVAGDPQDFDTALDNVVRRAPPGTCVDGQMLSWGLQNSMFDDTAFRQAWGRHMPRLQAHTSAWACHVLVGTAHHAAQLDGELLECAADRAPCVPLVLDALGAALAPQRVLASVRQPAQWAADAAVRLLAGRLPDLPDAALPQRLAWLHLNLPLGDELLASLERLFDRLVPGAQIVISDHERSTAQLRARKELDLWLGSRGYRALSLPTGQGLLTRR